MSKDNGTLTRADIAHALKGRLGITQARALGLVDAITEHIGRTLENGHDVTVPNFGRFHLNNKRGRVGRNPKTGAEHAIASRRVVTFRPSDPLRERVAAPLPDTQPAD